MVRVPRRTLSRKAQDSLVDIFKGNGRIALIWCIETDGWYMNGAGWSFEIMIMIRIGLNSKEIYVMRIL